MQQVNFVKDFCAFSLTFHQNREAFLQSLAKLGILPALEILLVSENFQLLFLKAGKARAAGALAGPAEPLCVPWLAHPGSADDLPKYG